MKIHLRKVLVSLLVIISFVSYALYQRFFGPQQTAVADVSPDTVADLGASETVSTTTVSQADNQSANQSETVPATSQAQKVSGNGGGDDGEYGDDEEDDDYGPQQTNQTSTGQTTTGGTSTTTAATSGSTTSTTTSSAGTATGTTTTTVAGTTAATALYKDGQYDGNAADAYYGLVQVRAIVQGGKLTDVVFLSYPNDRSQSIEINTYATPILKAEAIKVQSAKVNMVTGATNTSRAFINSLTTALSQAQL